MATEYQQEAEERKHHGFHKGNYVLKRTETDSSHLYTYVRTMPKIAIATKGAFPEKRCEIERILDGERVIEEVNVKDICHLDEWYAARQRQAQISTYWDYRVAKPIITATPEPSIGLEPAHTPVQEQAFVQLSLF